MALFSYVALCCTDCCLLCFPPRCQLTQFVCWHTVQLCKSVEKMLTLFVWALFPLAEILMHDDWWATVRTQYLISPMHTHTQTNILIHSIKHQHRLLTLTIAHCYQQHRRTTCCVIRGHPNITINIVIIMIFMLKSSDMRDWGQNVSAWQCFIFLFIQATCFI